MIVQQVFTTVFLSPLIIINRIYPSLLSYHHLMSSQLASALETLKSIGVMHCDISLANVMLVNHEKKPFRVKLIDFGLAHEVSSVPQGSTIQQCHYRSLTRACFKFCRWVIKFGGKQSHSCHHLTLQGSRGHAGSAPDRGNRHVVPGLLGCEAVPRCCSLSWKNREWDGKCLLFFFCLLHVGSFILLSFAVYWQFSSNYFEALKIQNQRFVSLAD